MTHPEHKRTAPLWKWLAVCLLVLLLILLPFFMAGRLIQEQTDRFLASAPLHPVWIACVLGGLLAADIFLPVPSSIVSTASGYLLGAASGALVSFAGMTIACLAGYWFSLVVGRPLVNRFVGATEIRRFDSLTARFGTWTIVICRAVPVLAEASVLLAGMGRMAFGRFAVMAALSNLGISIVYALIGAYSAEIHSFLIAFAAAMLLPGLAMLLARARAAPPPTPPSD